MKTVYDKPPRLTRRYLRDQKWVDTNIQELIDKYPNQWILVYDGNVLAHHEEPKRVWAKADELNLDQPYVTLIERDVYVY